MLDSQYGGVLIVFVQPPSSGSIEAKLSKWPVTRMRENRSHRTEWTTVGTEGPEKDTCCRTHRRAGDP